MTADIVAFVEARLAEDEAVALACLADYSHDGTSTLGPGGELRLSGGDWALHATPTAHILRHSPKRVLAEVAAKRAILAEHNVQVMPDQHGRSMTWWACPTCHPTQRPHDEEYDWALVEGCPTVRHLASVWRGHPDYREEWAP